MSYIWPIALMALTACNAAPAGKPQSERPSAARPSPAPPSPTRSASPAPQASASAQAIRDCKSGGLELELTPSRTEIRLGEPAVILVRLRNCSRTVADVPLEIEPEYSVLALSIHPPVGEPFQYLPPTTRETRRRLMVSMPPGAARGTVAHVYLDRTRRWIFSAPGSYRFTARLQIEKTSLESAPVELQVRAASGATSTEDLAGLWNSLGRALYLGSAKDAAAASAWLRRNRKLDYLQPFVRVADVMARSDQQYDAAQNTFVMGQCADIASEAKEIVRSVPDPYFGAVAAARLSKCLNQIRKAGEARELIEQVQTMHPRAVMHPAIADLLGDDKDKTLRR